MVKYMAKSPCDRHEVFLFSYAFQGDRYSLEVPARSETEAKFRVSSMANADLDGVIKMKTGSATGPLSRWLARLGL